MFANEADARNRSIVKFHCRAKDRQMGAGKAVQRPQEFRESSLVHHSNGSFAGIRIVEAGFLQFIVVFHLIQPPLRSLQQEPGVISCKQR